jgi:REP element-mobilizing transposase RayT
MQVVGPVETGDARRINALRGTPGAAVWQRGYDAHIIRDEPDLWAVEGYIINNPAQWENDR